MKNKKKIIITSIAILLIVLAVILFFLINRKENGNAKNNTTVYANQKIEETEEDKSVIVAQGDTKIDNDKITKTGDSSSLTESDKKGINSAILVDKKSDFEINNTEITTDGKGASGISATHVQAKVKVKDTSITTSQERSKGILVSNMANLEADNVTIKTTGDKSSGAVTDFRGGNLTIRNSSIETTGAHSSGVYSTGNVVVENTRINTARSSSAVIDGTGKITMTNCDIESGGKRAVYIYYTGANPKESVTGSFSMNGGSLRAKGGPAFYITNTKAEIEIENVNIEAETGVIINVLTDKSDLGMENEVNSSKGGDAIIIARKQELNGGIEVDSNSTLDLKMTDGSKLKGYINKENSAKNIKLTVEAGCTIELTDDCYVNEADISDGATIIENGHKIIVANQQ